MQTDPGLDVLEHIRAALEPADEWRRDEPRGFTWWPGPFAQRFFADEPRRSGGSLVWRVQAELPLLTGVTGDVAHYASLAGWNARNPGLSALRWNGDDDSVALIAGVYVRGADWPLGARDLAAAALLQLGDALRDGPALAHELGGLLAGSAPAGRALRADNDPLVEGWRSFAEAGARESPFDPGRLQLLTTLTPPPWLLANLDDTGLHAEVPCALEGEAAAGSAPGAGVARLHVLVTQPHPRLGAGVLIVLVPPHEAEPRAGRAAATAALLNEAEAREWTVCDALGAWCVHPAAGLAYVRFVPALLDRDGLLESVVWTMAARARWARRFLARVEELRAGESRAD